MPAPLTAEEAEYLKAQGIDPSQGQIAEDSSSEPSPETTQKGMSSAQAALATGKAHFGGWAGGGAGMAAASWLMGPEVGLPVSLIGGALGAFGGSALGQKGQELALGDKQRELEEEAQQAEQEHPIVSAGTDIVGSALAGGGKFNLSNIREAAGQLAGRNALTHEADIAAMKLGLPQALSTEGAESVAGQQGGRAAIGKLALGGVVNPAINTGLDLATGHTPTVGGIASQAIGGAFFSEPFALGRWMHGSGTHNDEPIPETTSKTIDTGETEQGVVSPWTSKDNSGNYIKDDDFTKSEYLKANVNTKSEMSKMSDSDALEARAENYNMRFNKPVDDMRQELHDAWVKQQADTAAKTPNVAPDIKPPNETGNTTEPSDKDKVVTEPTIAPSTEPDLKADQTRAPQSPSSTELAQQTALASEAHKALQDYQVAVASHGELSSDPSVAETRQKATDAAKRASDFQATLLAKQATPPTTDKATGVAPKTEFTPEQARQEAIEEGSIHGAPPDKFTNSKLKDTFGKLLTLYHGTGSDIDTFKQSKEGTLGKGIYLSPHPDFASNYAKQNQFGEDVKNGRVYPVHANLENPLIVEHNSFSPSVDVLQALGYNKDKASFIHENDMEQKGNITNEIQAKAIKAGYDGIIMTNKGKPNEVVVFNHKNIRSAITGEHMAPERTINHTPNKETQALADHIEAGKATTGSVLQHIANGTSEHAELAKHLLSVSTPEKLSDSVGSYKGNDSNIRSAYYPSTKSIVLNGDSSNVPVIMHEVLHSLTTNNLPKEFWNKKGLTLKKAMDDYIADPKGDPHIKELIHSYYEAANQLGVHSKLFDGIDTQRQRYLHEHPSTFLDIKTGKQYKAFNVRTLGEMSDLLSWLKERNIPIHETHDGGLDNRSVRITNESYERLKQEGHLNKFGAIQSNEMIPAKVRGVAGNPDIAARKIGQHGYAMGDLHEFMASIMDDKSFRDKLNELKSGLNDGKSLWSRIVDSIRNLLGVPVKEGSLLERTLKATEGIVKTPRPSKDILGDFSHGTPPKPKDPNEVVPKINRLGKIGGIVEPLYDKISTLGHHAAGAIADAFKATDNTRDQYVGESWNKIKTAMDKYGFSKQDGKQLDLVSEWENRHGQAAPLSMFRNRAQRAVYNVERQVYNETGQRRIANNEPVYRNGLPTKLQQDPTAHPTPIAPKVAETIKTGTDMAAIDKLKKDYVDNAVSYGKTPKVANAMWEEVRDSLTGNMKGASPNMSFFGGARLAQGVPLPKSWTVENYANRLESYYRRQALDNAFYKHVESDPKVMSALGETQDAWHKPIPKDPQGSLAGNSNIQQALRAYKGEAINPTTRAEGSITNLASTLFVGSPVMEMHKIASNVINGALALSDNPVQAARTAMHMITNISAGIEHATEGGTIKMTARSVGNFFDNNATVAERIQALAQGYRNLSSLGGRTDKWNMGLMQAGFESVLPAKVAKANAGDATAQQLIKKIDPEYKVGKTYSTKEIQSLASEASTYVHGSRDGRTMPAWMLNDSELSGFFKLAHWSISQTNRFMSDVYTPATKGNFTPLAVALLGSTVGGYVIRQEKEDIQGKHGNIPDLKEIAASQGGLSGNKGLVAYNLISACQYAGFAGILSQAIKYPVDKMMKNTPQGAVFPLDEIASDLSKQIGDFTAAKANDPNFDWGDASIALMNHILTTDIQLSRIGFNQGVNSGLITGTAAEKKVLSDKLGQLRRFDMASNLPYDDQEASTANQYMNVEQKKFKMEQDLPKAMSQLPALVDNILKTYGDRPDVMMSKLKALKENQYATFPSLETAAPSFAKYMDYLTKLKGSKEADSDYADYLKHKIVNEVKASAVP